MGKVFCEFLTSHQSKGSGADLWSHEGLAAQTTVLHGPRRPCEVRKSGNSGMDQLLWKVLSIGHAQSDDAFESKARELGHAEIQTV